MVKQKPPSGITIEDWDVTPESVQTLVTILMATVAELQQVIPQLQKQVEAQQKRISNLEEQMGQTSRNSSKPPSSDPPTVKKPPPKTKGKRKRGGQPGQVGHGRTLKPPEDVTRFVVSKPFVCKECGTLLMGEDPNPCRHQVSEIPRIEPELVEYQVHSLNCLACGHKNQGEWPTDMPRGCLGSRTQAIIGYLSGRMGISRRDSEEMLGTLFHLDIALGTISAQEKRVSQALSQPTMEASAFVRQQPVANVDETSWCEMNHNCWIWVATTPLVTVLHIMDSRSQASSKCLLGHDYAGVVGSDRHSAYNWLDLAHRQLCWSHLIRDFQAFVDRNGESAVIGKLLLTQVERFFPLWHLARDGTLSRSDFQKAMQPIRQEIGALLQIGAYLTVSKTKNTCRNILKAEAALWTFVDQEGVEPTNNAAERALRRSVIWRRRSFGSQSEAGSRFVERIQTAVLTLRQQNRDVLDFLTEACQAAIVGSEPPSLLPVT